MVAHTLRRTGRHADGLARREDSNATRWVSVASPVIDVIGTFPKAAAAVFPRDNCERSQHDALHRLRVQLCAACVSPAGGLCHA